MPSASGFRERFLIGERVRDSGELRDDTSATHRGINGADQ
jgi:hypothetical protein